MTTSHISSLFFFWHALELYWTAHFEPPSEADGAAAAAALPFFSRAKVTLFFVSPSDAATDTVCVDWSTSPLSGLASLSVDLAPSTTALDKLFSDLVSFLFNCYITLLVTWLQTELESNPLKEA